MTTLKSGNGARTGRLLARCIVALAYCLSIGCEAQAVAADSQPVIAVVADHEQAGFADLLLAQLTSQGTYQLVEREEFWRVHQEIESAAGLGRALEMARRIRADGLLIVTGDKNTSVRLVETTRGVVLARWLLNPGDGPAGEAARCIAQALAANGARLRIPPEARLFVSVRPEGLAGLARSDALLFARLHSVVAFELSRQPSLFLVERESFAAVGEERASDDATARDYAPADSVVTIRSGGEGGASFRCICQVRGSTSGSVAAREFEVDDRAIENTATSIVAFLCSTLPPQISLQRASLRHEAAAYRYLATSAAGHHDYRRALPALELACLLCPEERTWRNEFMHIALLHLAKNASGSRNGAQKFSEDDHIEYVHWLRQAVIFGLSADSAISPAKRLFREVRPFFFLTRDVRGFQPRNAYGVSSLRAELRAMLPVVAGGNATVFAPGDIALYADVAPLFFDEAESAIASLKGLMTFDSFPIAALRENAFTVVSGWDRDHAGRLWLALLEELGQTTDVAKQATSLMGLCFYHNAFDQNAFRSASPTAKEAVLKLFEWMAVNPDAARWMLEEETWYIHLRLWFALGALPLDKQDHYYGALMLRLVKRDPKEERNAVQFLRNRWLRNVKEGQKPDDIPVIQAHMKWLHETICCPEGTHFDEWLKPQLTEEWIREIFSGRAQGDAMPYPEVPGGRLIFDSAAVLEGGPQQKTHDFEGLNGYLDGQWLWMAWSGVKTLGLVCIDTKAKTCRYFLVPAEEGTSATARTPLVIARARDRLFVAEARRVYCMPLQGDPPEVVLRDVTTLGPKIGRHQLGVTFKTRPEKYLSAMVGFGSDLYFSLSQPIADGVARNLYGAMYRWDGSKPPVELAASDSLMEGPLNNCLPYNSFTAFADEAHDTLYFVLAASPGQSRSSEQGQRNGIWQYSPTTNGWRQVVEHDFVYRTAALGLHVMRLPGIYDLCDDSRSYRYAIVPAVLSQGPPQVSSLDMVSSFVCRNVVENGVRGQDLLYVSSVAHGEASLCRVKFSEFVFQRVLSVADGVYIMLAALQPGGKRPTNRGLVYFVPIITSGVLP